MNARSLISIQPSTESSQLHERRRLSDAHRPSPRSLICTARCLIPKPRPADAEAGDNSPDCRDILDGGPTYVCSLGRLLGRKSQALAAPIQPATKP